MDSKSWIAKEFSTLTISDVRLHKRFQKVASALLNSPTKTINQAMGNWTDSKAAYRLFDNDKLERDAIITAHQHSTLDRANDFENDILLAIQDTTTLNYTHHPKTVGIKKLHQQEGYDKEVIGFHVHNLLLTTDDGIPLGLLRQDVFQNEGLETNFKHLPINQKKSFRWLEALRTTNKLSQQGKKVITICDREADIYEFLSEAEFLDEKYIIRGKNNRHLSEEGLCVGDKLAQKKIAGRMKLSIPGNGSRKQRTATLSIRFSKVTIAKPKRHSNAKVSMAEEIGLNVIWATEKQPKKNQQPINWVLFTNCPLETVEHAKKCLTWYQKRWRIEEFHKVMKSGCNAENCYLRSYEKVSKFVALISVIAYRLYWITLYSRVMPTSPGTEILKPYEISALYFYLKKDILKHPPTARDICHMIAKLGGFLGRKNDNNPGITVMWRGWQKLQTLSEMWLLMNENTHNMKTYG